MHRIFAMNSFMRRTSVAVATSPLCRKGRPGVAALLLSMWLVGCGQKGPLALPPAASAASAPALPR